MLLPLVLDAAGLDATTPDAEPRPVPDLPHARCGFCGQPSPGWLFAARTFEGAPTVACALCHLPLRLDRPRIDQEAVLVWLPEMSQAALNALVRAIHIDRRSRGDDLVHGEPPRPHPHGLAPALAQVAAWHASAAIAARSAAAADRLGTELPSELAAALHQLSPATRARLPELLAGLRLLPLGRFFLDAADVYPDVVDAWRKPVGAGAPGHPLPATPSLPPNRPAILRPRHRET